MFTEHDQKTAANPIKYRAILKQHALIKQETKSPSDLKLKKSSVIKLFSER